MNHTHQKLIALLLGAGLLGLSGMANAAIVNSKHDLGSASTSGGNKVTGTAALGTGTDETCVFCHTPHAASTPTLPLWNKAVPTTTYTAYSSTTMDGTANFTGSTSMACLSCHDGTQAMDNIVNATSSATSANYAADGGGADGLGYTWTGATVDGNGYLSSAAVTNLSSNLGDDHPIAIPYGGGGITTTLTTAATTDPDFGQVNVARPGQPTLTTASIGGVQKWWFDTDTDSKMDTDEIRLYTANNQPQVECASCHDPHKGENVTFLRIANTSSAVCTACHVK